MAQIVETEFLIYWREINFHLKARKAFLPNLDCDCPFATAIAGFGKLNAWDMARYMAWPSLDLHQKRLTRED